MVPETRQQLVRIADSLWDRELVSIDPDAISLLTSNIGGFGALSPPPFPSTGEDDQSCRMAFMIHVAAQLFQFWFLSPNGDLRKFSYARSTGSMAMLHLYDDFWQGREVALSGARNFLLQAPMGQKRIEIAQELNQGARWLMDDYIPWVQVRLESGSAGVYDAAVLAHQLPIAFSDPFLKKAQLAVSFLAGVYNDAHSAAVIPDLEAFSDYQVPRVLRSLGILRYAQRLADAVDSHKPIEPDSEMEVSIRGATIKACNMIALQAQISPVLIDNLLWHHQSLAGESAFHLCPTSHY